MQQSLQLRSCLNVIMSIMGCNIPYSDLDHCMAHGHKIGMVYENMSQIYLNGEITYRGNGDERREYIHVEDAAKLAVKSLDEQYNGRQLVLSGSQSYTAKQILDLIFEIVGRKPNIIFNETTADNDHYKTTPYRFNADKPTKISPTESVDFGQNIADLIAEVHEANNNTA